MSVRNIVFQMPNGLRISVAVGESAYCTPRENNARYTAVEVGYPTGIIPDSWKPYAEIPDVERSDIYGWLPTELLADWFNANK